MTTSATLSKDSWLRSFMEKVSLKDDGSNFVDWEANLRNVAQADGKLKFLTEPNPLEPGARATPAQRASYEEHMKEAYAVKNVLIFAMQEGLKRRFIKSDAHGIFSKLTTMFSQAPRILQYDAAVRFFEARLVKRQSVSAHVLKMIETVETLERLGSSIPQELAVDRILHSLHEGFTQFRVNFNMNDMKKSLHEIHSLLVQAEKDMGASGSSRKDVLFIKDKTKFKNSGKGKKPARAKESVQGKGKAKVSEASIAKPKT